MVGECVVPSGRSSCGKTMTTGARASKPRALVVRRHHLLYSQQHLVPTYTKSQITPLKNNYNAAPPDPGYIPGWRLTLGGLSSGLAVSLDIEALLARHRIYDQITRLVCVEGWSAIAWWSGLRFDDLLHAYPPVSEAKWAHLESSVNLDANGNPDL